MYNPQNPPGLDPATVARGGMYGYGQDSGMGAAPTAGVGGGAPLTTSLPQKGIDYLKGGGLPGMAYKSLFGGSQGFDISGASGYLGQIPDVLKKYFEPYQEMLDPTSKLKELGGGFTASPGYQYSLSQAMKGIGSAAAAGGMAGSPMQQQQAAGTAQGLASQDYGQYMQRAMGMFGQGAAGYRGLGEDLASNLMSQAHLQQLQQEEEAKEREQSSSDMWGALGKIGGAAATMAFL